MLLIFGLPFILFLRETELVGLSDVDAGALALMTVKVVHAHTGRHFASLKRLTTLEQSMETLNLFYYAYF